MADRSQLGIVDRLGKGIRIVGIGVGAGKATRLHTGKHEGWHENGEFKINGQKSLER